MRAKALFVAAVLVFAVTPSRTLAQQWKTWHLAPAEATRAVFANKRFFILHSDGSLSYSKDGTSWKSTSVVGGVPLLDIVYDPATNEYIVVGGSGYIGISKDLNQWEALPQKVGRTLRAVAFGSGTLVSVGESGVVLRSEDGKRWQIISAKSDVGNLTSLTYGNGKFVAAGDAGLYTSEDGVHWEKGAISTNGEKPGFAKVVYDHQYDQFYALGRSGLSTSKDGMTWQAVPVTFPMWLQAVWRYIDIAVGSGNISISLIATAAKGNSFPSVVLTVDTTRHEVADATTSNYSLVIPKEKPQYLAFGNSILVAATEGGKINLRVDGGSWKEVALGLDEVNIWQATFNGKVFLASNYFSGIIRSTNGYVWQPMQTPSFDSEKLGTLTALAYCDGDIIGIDEDNNRLMRITDGRVEFRKLNIDLFRRDEYSLTCFRKRNKKAVGTEIYLSSVDKRRKKRPLYFSYNGESWEEVEHAEYVTAIAWDGTRYVAVGPSGYVGVSANLSEWEKITLSPRIFFVGIAYGDGVFVASASIEDDGGCAILASLDGERWHIVERNSACKSLGPVAYGNGAFIIPVYSGGVLVSASRDIAYSLQTK